MAKKLIGIIVLTFMLGTLLACGATASRDAAPPVVEEVFVEKAVEREAPAADTSNPATASDQDTTERMLIWNASISLTVRDTEVSLRDAQAIARKLGGYSVSSESWKDNEQLFATLTIRVPAERFDEALSQLRELAVEVDRESASSQDVTDEYVDLDARLRHLKAKEAQLLEFLDEAKDTEGVLAVYEQLSTTQAEVEQVKGRMVYLETLTAMATISIDLHPEEADLPILEEGWKPGRTSREAARALVNTFEFFANIAIWIGVYLLPILIIVLIPVAAVFLFIRHRSQKKRTPPSESAS